MTERPGLYIIAIIGMLAAIKSCKNTVELVSKAPLELKVEDVMGGSEPEKFYEINGRRCFLEIDKTPVKDYIASR